MKKILFVLASVIICFCIFVSTFSGVVLAYDEEYPLIIVLDPGHGGVDPGAENKAAFKRHEIYACEREINLTIAEYCKQELKNHPNIKVYLTRTTNDLSDVSKSSIENGKLTYTARGTFAGNKHANAFISIHCNSSENSGLRGAEVYYPIDVSWCPNAHTVGKGLGNSILSQLAALGIANRGAKTRTTTLPETERYPDGSVMDYYSVMNSARSCHVPAIIVEHAYINNASDYNAFLNSEEKLKKLGVADAKGILEYFKTNDDKWIFNDVGLDKQWYSEPVRYMKEKGYINGYTNGCFGPNDRIKRQDFVVILSNIMNIDQTQYGGKSKFPDVAKGSYYNAAVNWAYSEGILSGYDNGCFGVGDYLTREQMVTILYNFVGNYLNIDIGVENNSAENYDDFATTSAFARDAIVWAIDRGLISGYNATTIGPRRYAERSHVAKILMNAEITMIHPETEQGDDPAPTEE